MQGILTWIVAVLAALNFGYMCFDGTRALVVGDYLRPTNGEHAGELGPWTYIVSAIGIEPESTMMKTIFVLWGVVGLICTVRYILNVGKSRRLLLILNFASLWYIMVGAVSSAAQILLLLIQRKKNDITE